MWCCRTDFAPQRRAPGGRVLAQLEPREQAGVGLGRRRRILVDPARAQPEPDQSLDGDDRRRHAVDDRGADGVGDVRAEVGHPGAAEDDHVGLVERQRLPAGLRDPSPAHPAMSRAPGPGSRTRGRRDRPCRRRTSTRGPRPVRGSGRASSRR